jgi:hypothetical protein
MQKKVLEFSDESALARIELSDNDTSERFQRPYKLELCFADELKCRRFVTLFEKIKEKQQFSAINIQQRGNKCECTLDRAGLYQALNSLRSHNFTLDTNHFLELLDSAEVPCVRWSGQVGDNKVTEVRLYKGLHNEPDFFSRFDSHGTSNQFRYQLFECSKAARLRILLCQEIPHVDDAMGTCFIVGNHFNHDGRPGFFSAIDILKEQFGLPADAAIQLKQNTQKMLRQRHTAF